MAEALIHDVDWSAYEVSVGPATSVGRSLQSLLSSSNTQEAPAAWAEIEEFVFSQGGIYSAAEPAVSVALAALAENPPPWRSGRILDLLFFILSGDSLTDFPLRDRCRERAREGLWLLVQWAQSHTGWGARTRSR